MIRQRFVTSHVLPRGRRRALLFTTPLVLVLLIGAAGLTAGQEPFPETPSEQADPIRHTTISQRDNHRQEVLAAFRMVP